VGARLGQHFLRDARVLDDILAAAAVREGERVLEVGPGPGNLTERLARAVGPAGQVVAIEADAALAAPLEGRWPNVEVLEGDAVRTDLAGLGRFDRIVANLPYLISGPITAAFLDLLRRPETRWRLAVLMFQREFALRLLAPPGGSDYGRLTVHAARWCRATRVRDVPPGAFDPPPRVDSMVVRMEPHPQPPFAVRDEALWRAAVDGTFQRRRKQLRNSLPAALAGAGVPREAALAALEALGWQERRPENLAPAEFALLVDRVAEARA
jgi:16S rRNA (adenine1518-N6/adenine1519-N6)-dimethyltransferase